MLASAQFGRRIAVCTFVARQEVDMRTIALALLLGAFVGCARHATPPAQQPVSTTETTAAAAPGPSTNEIRVDAPARVTITTTVEPAPAMRMACNLPDEANEAPRFASRSIDLSPHDQEILHAIGVCLTTGPLAGKEVCITGYTDPRGATQQNYALGLARGYTAEHYLERFGVKPEQTSVASAGETKARGTDEAGWAKDRRVEIDLADAPDSPCR
jgi:peptidoglycan-associated lipoprotein